MSEHLTVVGRRGGEYILDEELPDGRLVIRADTSAEAMDRRLGLDPATEEEAQEMTAFLSEHRAEMLPADNEQG